MVGVAPTLRSWLAGQRFRVLMYHSVSTDATDPFAVSPALLADQIDALIDAGYRLVTLSAALQAWSEGADLRSVVALTFDDAFEDFVQGALSPLTARDVQATVFAPLGELGAVASWAPGVLPKRIMARQEIVAASEQGIEVGCHGYEHVRLPALSPEELDDHLRRAVRIMDDLQFARPYGFAYPYGDADEPTRRQVKRAGFDYAALAGGLWGNGASSDRWSLTRIPVTSRLSPGRLMRLLGRQGDIQRLTRHLARRWSLPRAARLHPTITSSSP